MREKRKQGVPRPIVSIRCVPAVCAFLALDFHKTEPTIRNTTAILTDGEMPLKSGFSSSKSCEGPGVTLGSNPARGSNQGIAFGLSAPGSGRTLEESELKLEELRTALD